MKKLVIIALIAGLVPNLPAAQELPEPIVSSRGPHSAEWTRTTTQMQPNGRLRTNSSSYTELSVGLNYLKDGEWRKSQEIIELFQGGAVFRQAQYKVIFDPNAAAPQGAIDVEMPNGKRWRSTVLGIAIIDPATQRSELIAEIKDCVGELRGPNTVIYPDAFDFNSGARASLRFSCTRDRFEQDIIFLDRIDLPPGYGAGSRLEIWSEIFAPPDFVKTTRQIGGVPDDHLDFGNVIIGSGRALTLEDPQGLTWSAPVCKAWTRTPEGRTVLVESLHFQSIAAQLNTLPAPQGAALKKPGPARQMALNTAGQRSFPPRKEPAKNVGQIKAAAATPKDPPKADRAALKPAERGLVADYSMVVTASDMVFKAGSTYFVGSSPKQVGKI